MGQIRIYHADCSSDFRKLFKQAVCQTPDMLLLGSSPDGSVAERSIRQMQPDVLVMSLTLQVVDGIELIDRVCKLACRPRIIVVSYLVRDFCIEEAMRHGADYFMLKPCTLPLLLARVRELALLQRETLCGAALPARSDPDSPVDALLDRIGISPELSGYRYVAEAVRITLLHGSGSMTKDLYPQIALIYRVTGSAVERAIRHAIDAAWRGPATAARLSLFPGRDKPSNSRFILRLASFCESSDAGDSPFLRLRSL